MIQLPLQIVKFDSRTLTLNILFSDRRTLTTASIEYTLKRGQKINGEKERGRGRSDRYRSLRLFVRSSILSTFLILCIRFARLAASLRDAVEAFGIPGKEMDFDPGSVLLISILESRSRTA